MFNLISNIFYKKQWANKLSINDINLCDTMPEITVSICIPTYNTPLKTFEKCLYSILAQDFENFEVIISDDSSNENMCVRINNSNLL